MTSTPYCLGWMQTQKSNLSPCTVAQDVGQLCISGYTVSSASFQESNYVPNATTANVCTCSWSAYNLLSACTYCVTEQENFTSWTTWTTDCGSFVSNTTYLPSGYYFPQGIPYWAAANPSNWYDGTFNITQAANLAEEDKPDETGATSTPSTTTAPASSSISVGAIVGAVVGGVVIIIAGGLLIFWVVRCRRRRRKDTVSTGESYFAPGPSIWNLAAAQPTPLGYAHVPAASVTTRLTSPRSTSSLAASLTSPTSPVSSNGRTTSPITDAADMITPFTYSKRHSRRSNMTQLTGKASEALSEHSATSTSQRARLNPPPYSTSSPEPGPSSGVAPTWERRLSMKKERRRNGSASGATTYSGHSRTSTRESVTTAPTVSRVERQTGSQPHAPGRSTGAAIGTSGSIGNGGAEMREHPPAI